MYGARLDKGGFIKLPKLGNQMWRLERRSNFLYD